MKKNILYKISLNLKEPIAQEDFYSAYYYFKDLDLLSNLKADSDISKKLVKKIEKIACDFYQCPPNDYPGEIKVYAKNQLEDEEKTKLSMWIREQFAENIAHDFGQRFKYLDHNTNDYQL